MSVNNTPWRQTGHLAFGVKWGDHAPENVIWSIPLFFLLDSEPLSCELTSLLHWAQLSYHQHSLKKLQWMWSSSSATLILNNCRNTPIFFLSLRASAAEPQSIWGQTAAPLPRIKVKKKQRGSGLCCVDIICSNEQAESITGWTPLCVCVWR